MFEITKNHNAPWSWGEGYKKNIDYKLKEIQYKKWIGDKSNSLNNISKILDIEVLYYEDLYYNTEVCNLQGLKFYPDKTKKLYS